MICATIKANVIERKKTPSSKTVRCKMMCLYSYFDLVSFELRDRVHYPHSLNIEVPFAAYRTLPRNSRLIPVTQSIYFLS